MCIHFFRICTRVYLYIQTPTMKMVKKVLITTGVYVCICLLNLYTCIHIYHTAILKMVKKLLMETCACERRCELLFGTIHVYTHVLPTETEDGKTIVDEYWFVCVYV
jgi:hypothetical protein